jgi:two-component system OmpR family sensor kinase
VEIVLQVVLVGLAVAVVGHLQGREMPERGLGTLTFAAGVAATILMGVAAWLSASRRARRVAAAVGVYTAGALWLQAVRAEGGVWAIVGSVSVLAVAGLLVLAARPSWRMGRGRGVSVVAVAGTVPMAVVALLAPAYTPSPDLVRWTDLAGWAVVGAAGLLLVGRGLAAGHPLLRRTGLAFAALGSAHALGTLTGRPLLAGALELGAVAMLLVAATTLMVAAIGAIGQQELSRSRLAEVEAVMASVAERDHELRNVVAGLNGAASVLRDDELGRSDDGRKLLLAATAELARLQQMLDGAVLEQGPAEARVTTILEDLAVVHRAAGLDVDVDVVGEPEAAINPAVLAQVITNLLINCRRHAPGASVTLRAGVQAGKVRIEVADDGPGLCAPPEVVLQRGVRGPASSGGGLGLSITAELVERHRGTFSLVSGAGCTAVLELPAAACRTPVLA